MLNPQTKGGRSTTSSTEGCFVQGLSSFSSLLTLKSILECFSPLHCVCGGDFGEIWGRRGGLRAFLSRCHKYLTNGGGYDIMGMMEEDRCVRRQIILNKRRTRCFNSKSRAMSAMSKSSWKTITPRVAKNQKSCYYYFHQNQWEIPELSRYNGLW